MNAFGCGISVPWQSLQNAAAWQDAHFAPVSAAYDAWTSTNLPPCGTPAPWQRAQSPGV